MTKRALLLFLAVLASAPPALAGGGWRVAQGDPDGGRPPNSLGEGYAPQQDEARRGVQAGLKPLSEVLADIQRRRPGRQLDTGIEDRNGRPSYRVRWEDRSGKRMDFIVDARSGAVLSVEER